MRAPKAEFGAALGAGDLLRCTVFESALVGLCIRYVISDSRDQNARIDRRRTCRQRAQRVRIHFVYSIFKRPVTVAGGARDVLRKRSIS